MHTAPSRTRGNDTDPRVDTQALFDGDPPARGADVPEFAFPFTSSDFRGATHPSRRAVDTTGDPQ